MSKLMGSRRAVSGRLIRVPYIRVILDLSVRVHCLLESLFQCNQVIAEDSTCRTLPVKTSECQNTLGVGDRHGNRNASIRSHRTEPLEPNLCAANRRLTGLSLNIIDILDSIPFCANVVTRASVVIKTL